MMILGFAICSNQYLIKTHTQNIESLKILEQYTDSTLYNQTPFKPDLRVVYQQISQLKHEQLVLSSLLDKLSVIIFIFIFIQLLSIFYLTFNYKLSSFDGLFFSLFPIISGCFILIGLNYFNHQFTSGENANNQLIKSIYYLMFITTPLFSFIGYQLNKKEITLHVNQLKWINYLCLALLIISITMVIISMFGLFLVPDLSNFKN